MDLFPSETMAYSVLRCQEHAELLITKKRENNQSKYDLLIDAH